MTTEMTFSVAQCLGGDDFLAQTFGQRYHVSRGSSHRAASLLTWDDVNAILTHHRLDAPRLRLAKDGQPLATHTYSRPTVTRRRTAWQRLQPADLHQQLAEGATLVLDAVDELHPGAAQLAMDLERWLRTAVQINLYASWTSTEGFGIHWDDHDVVVIQLDGSKCWRLYGPTRVAPMHRDVQAPDSPPADPVAELVLDAGDVLYLPRGWWHAVAASSGQASLHLTCGLQTTTGADVIAWLSDSLRTHELVRSDVPRFGSTTDQAAFTEHLAKLVMSELTSPDLLPRFLAARDATEQARLAPSLPYVRAVPSDPQLWVQLLVTRPALDTTPEGDVRLTAGGEEWTFARRVRPLLELLESGFPQKLSTLAESGSLTVAETALVVSELVNGQVAGIKRGAE
ncbi:cupin domain-containing protein [Streptomyces sp. NPDC050546]|uniref:cupin domain-containing protein n=1 Tax=Streptomyces sp. NPDC050546 TaxID=3365628 RepID=UPI0037A20507